MSVENKEVIDFISIDKLDNVVLTISDHLLWDDVDNHSLILQDKINSYLEVIENEQIYEIYPDARGRKFAIQVALKYFPDGEGKDFLERVKSFLESNDYKFSYYELRED